MLNVSSARRLLSLLLLVPLWFPAAGMLWAAPPLHKQIDAAIEKQAGGPLAAVADDAEFLRRAFLDLAGKIPTAEEARKFLADQDPAKRQKLIDRLLASEDYARRMQEAIAAMLLERRIEKTIPDADWENYLRESFAANKPWDVLVGELLFTPDGEDKKPRPPKKFYLAAGRADAHQLTRDVGRLFLGRDMMCAQCHNHPNVDDYPQADYFGLYSYLQQKPEQASNEFESVFVPGKKTTGPRLPGLEEVSIPTFEKPEKGKEKEQEEEKKKFLPRLLLARDLPSAENRLFVKNSVNRFWYLLMGRGLVHPLDLHHAGNPPSHPELLDQLCAEFVAHKFDVKYLLREIALSNSYARSSVLPEGVELQDVPAEKYRVAIPKPLSPEQMAWNVMQASGNLETMLKAPVPENSEFTYYDYINGRIDKAPDNIADAMKLFVGVFGNPPGEAEVEFNPALGHALFLMNERLVLDWLKPQGDNLVARLAKQNDAAAIADELYLSVLTRLPTEDEQAEVAEYLEEYQNRRNEALGELAWALLASAEFRVNH